MNAWQPIETAPKDGSEILSWCPPWAGFDGTVDLVYRAGDEWQAIGNDRPVGIRATHWMPLPAPPEAEPDSCSQAIKWVNVRAAGTRGKRWLTSDVQDAYMAGFAAARKQS